MNALKGGDLDPCARYARVNDLAEAEALAHMFEYDGPHRRYQGTVEAKDNAIIIDGVKVPIINEKDAKKLPWGDENVDIAIEATGIRTEKGGPMGFAGHQDAGAPHVILTVPAKKDNEIDYTAVWGANEDGLDPSKHYFLSNASCTTNNLAQMAKVLEEAYGIRSGFMNTVHAGTNDMVTRDQIHPDLRRARSADYNIIPTTTGAAKAIGLVIPELAGKLDGMSNRVPVEDGSITYLITILENMPDPKSAEHRAELIAEINAHFKRYAQGELSHTLEYTEAPIVSQDVIGNPKSAVLDGLVTDVMPGGLTRTGSWYDNEWGYSNRVVDLSNLVGEKKVAAKKAPPKA